jgi:hypothetical protein
LLSSSPVCRNIFIPRNAKSLLHPMPSRPSEGRFAIVTNVGRDAVDADALLTNGADADGEVVWSCSPVLFSFAKEPIKLIKTKGFGQIG